ncbi:endo-1,4-beta-xylanase [uncultured Nocardioides sp.]|uniref:endo-1,4-beta-xylanase n=1 Tax=uncultured Nocardioides sp. TaxID=198441 RepID=UPI00263115FB|nr:endo-1,4-beta-xylanase [uncultured Nocardioides sp.]
MTLASGSGGNNDQVTEAVGVTPAAMSVPAVEGRARSMLRSGSWRYVPGVTARDGTLHVARTGLATLLTSPEDQKTQPPTYQPNPPVVLAGPHVALARGSDVRIAAGLEDIRGTATVSFMSGPNRRFDERVEHQAGIDVSVTRSVATLTIWSDEDREPRRVRMELDGPRTSDVQITLRQRNGRLTVSVDGQPFPVQRQVFGRQAWFGMSAEKSFVISSLDASPLRGTRLRVEDMARDPFAGVTPSRTGLASVAAAHGRGDKRIGTAVDLAQLLANPRYARYVIRNFNEIQTETMAKFQALQPRRGEFQFAELDALVAFAERHDLDVQGHALVFGEAYPRWLHRAMGKASKDEALAIMRRHITEVVRRYDGHHGHGLIQRWDVVNEPFDPDHWGRLNKDTIWYRAIGESYIEEAFEAARAANPDGEFGLNDWSIETDRDRRQAVIDLLRRMPQGTVDYVGLQAHFDEDTLDDDAVMEAILGGGLPRIFQEFAGLGVEVRVSEASVARNGDAHAQAAVYARLLGACLRSANCIGFNMWGATSNEWYFTTTPDRGIGDDAPTTQSGDGPIVERPAMQAMRRAAAG